MIDYNAPTMSGHDEPAKAELLGEIHAWKMPSKRIIYADVNAALDVAGFSRELAKDLRPATALSRALADLCKGKDKAIDRIRTEDDKAAGVYRFQLSRKVLDAAGLQLDYTPETLVTLDPNATETITCPNADVQQAARDLFAVALDERTTSDITRLVQSIYRSQADLYAIVPDKGVAYFVPAQFADFCGRIDSFISAMGGSLSRFPVPKGTAAGNASVRDAVQTGLAALADELDAKVATWDATTRPGTMQRTTDELKTLIFKVEAYAEYLQSSTEGLRARLTAARHALAEKIQQVTEEKANAKDERRAARRDAAGQTLAF